MTYTGTNLKEFIAESLRPIKALNPETVRTCDLCLHFQPAVYDAKTVRGPWADLCDRHFITHGVGLGVGKGSRL
jgi:hypothetical protein